MQHRHEWYVSCNYSLLLLSSVVEEWEGGLDIKINGTANW